jgi:purine-binding chemotaxis protein CheW
MADLTRSPRTAVRRTRGEKATRLREFLAFNLAADTYGLELARIREIVSPPPITEVPRAARDVVGVCSVRGLLVTVIDLRRRLRLEERPTTRLTRILLSYTDSGEVVGLLVDEVLQVVRLKESEIELASSVLGGDMSDHVMGIGRPAGDIIVLLDLSTMVVM